MLPKELGDLAQYLNVPAQGSVPISGFAIDSRKAVAGDLFVALVANRDGHDYINSAAKNGAAAALVSKPTNLIPSICVKIQSALWVILRIRSERLIKVMFLL